MLLQQILRNIGRFVQDSVVKTGYRKLLIHQFYEISRSLDMSHSFQSIQFLQAMCRAHENEILLLFDKEHVSSLLQFGILQGNKHFVIKTLSCLKYML